MCSSDLFFADVVPVDLVGHFRQSLVELFSGDQNIFEVFTHIGGVHERLSSLITCPTLGAPRVKGAIFACAPATRGATTHCQRNPRPARSVLAAQRRGRGSHARRES